MTVQAFCRYVRPPPLARRIKGYEAHLDGVEIIEKGETR